MEETYFKIKNIPAVVYGGDAEKAYIFIHGKCSCKEEARAFAEIAVPKGFQVIGADLPEHGERKGETGTFDPWHAVPELREVMEYAEKRCKHISLRANSIGAWFSMLAFRGKPLEKSLFVSPILDMEKLIRDMMLWANVTEAELEEKGEIQTSFGETLSWKYYQYAQNHPIAEWSCPTAILYAGRDNLTERETVDTFVRRFGCAFSIMEDGEHWFHTPEQLEILNRWTDAQTDRTTASDTPDIY